MEKDYGVAKLPLIWSSEVQRGRVDYSMVMWRHAGWVSVQAEIGSLRLSMQPLWSPRRSVATPVIPDMCTCQSVHTCHQPSQTHIQAHAQIQYMPLSKAFIQQNFLCVVAIRLHGNWVLGDRKRTFENGTQRGRFWKCCHSLNAGRWNFLETMTSRACLLCVTQI